MNATEQSEITRYVDGVRAALADLPAPVREELLEDLADHLAEVAAEADGTLEERLGPPAAYAAELRATAGVTGSGRSPRFQWDAARLRASRAARSADVRLGRTLGYERASDFGRLLRPGWWVLRGYLLALLFLGVFFNEQRGLLPSADESAWVWFGVVAVGVIASVRLGKATLRQRRWPAWLVMAGNTLLVLAVLVVANVDGSEMFTEPASVHESPYMPAPAVYPYDRDGRPIPDARLIDVYGNEVPIGGNYCDVVGRAGGDPWSACVVPFPFPSIPPLREAPVTGPPVPDRAATPPPSPDPTVTPAPSPPSPSVTPSPSRSG
ncbi:MAG TPA: hypothetical protein VFR67_12200 [Pilimelia sp.]|nr:hypothetical protein [Pilimelia sp.]